MTITSTERVQELEKEGDIAADYLEGLLDIADIDGDIDMDVEGDRAMVAIVGSDLDLLVGSDGEVMESLQELTRLTVTQATGEHSRLMLDVGGTRAAKKASLQTLGSDACNRVNETGMPVSLDPMTAFERKVIHDVVAAAGLRTESHGEEPNRFVLVLPASSPEADSADQETTAAS